MSLYRDPTALEAFIVAVHVKRTYELGRDRPMRRSAHARPLSYRPTADAASANSLVACHQTDADVASSRKLATDVVVHGFARSPKAVGKMRVAARVGRFWRHVDVFGDRRVMSRPGCRPRFSDPEPFRTMEVTWRRALGGVDPFPRAVPPLDDQLFYVFAPETLPTAFAPNPAGVGWTSSNPPVGWPLPNLEQPLDSLTMERLSRATHWTQLPMPAGYGWLPLTWFPRSTLGQMLTGPRYADLPETFQVWVGGAPEPDPEFNGPSLDPRIFNAASWSLPLRGDELVDLHGFDDRGPIRTALPGEVPVIEIRCRGEIAPASVGLHTVELFPDDNLATLVWGARASVRLRPRMPVPSDPASLDLYSYVDAFVDGAQVHRADFCLTEP